METKNYYDCIIMGKGPAGLSAALYLQRANLSTLVIGKTSGSLVDADIQNYFGVSKKTKGIELIENTTENLKSLGTEFLEDYIVKINPQNLIEVTTESGKKYLSKFLVIAIGRSKNQITQKSGISYCATCDGFFYRNKVVAVKGNNPYALEEAEYLENVCKKVYILTDGEPKISTNIEVIDKKIDDLIFTDDKFSAVKFGDFILELDGLFISDMVTTSSMQGFGIITKNGHIKINENYQTNIKNIYAAGDITGTPYQVAKAVYDGMMCGYSIIKEFNIQKQLKDSEK